MANMLDKYTENVDEAAVPTSEPISKFERQRVLKEKELRALRKLAKAFRKYNKRLKQDEEKRRTEEEAAKKAAAEKANKSRNNSGVRGFLNKLGDAICKAVPKLLTTIATVALGFFFKTRFAGKAQQAA